MRYLLAVAAGAALEYFLDPDRGRRRRNIARDRVTALARRTGVQVGRKSRYAASRVQGLARQVGSALVEGEQRLLEGAALAQKVRSEVFAEVRVPKGKISVNAVGRTVELRGELDSQDAIDALETRVLEVPGVHAVENYLHLPAQTS